mgnify:CR=1 FL=1
MSDEKRLTPDGEDRTTSVSLRRSTSRELDGLASIVVDSALHVHRGLGPGLIESVYESVLKRDLERRGLTVDRQVDVSFEFDGMIFKEGLRVDLLVERALVLELKSTPGLSSIHFQQVLTYIRLLDTSLGLLLNFGAARLKDGCRRVVNGHVDS